ncbi:MAG: tetratricopeptide repeat protein [Gemmataceae bacterium]
MLWLLVVALSDPQPVPVVRAEPLPAAEAAKREALARYALGRWRNRQDRPADAAKQLEAAVKADPAAAEPHRRLAQLYADLGRDAAAVRVARKAVELDPADAATGQLLAQLLYDGKKYADAARVLARTADALPPTVDPARRLGVLRDWGRAAEQAGDWAGMEAALTRAAAVLADRRADLLKTTRFTSPQDLDREAALVQEALGRAFTGAGKFAAATAAYREAQRRSPDPAVAARLDWNLSAVLQAEGKTAEALAAVERFLRLKPGGVGPYQRYVDLRRRAGQTVGLAADLGRLADADPANPAPRWLQAAELGRADPLAGDRRFRELADAATDPALFGVLVRFYKEADRADLLLQFVNETYTAARPSRPEPGDPPPDAERAALAAGERGRRLTAAVKAEPGLTAPLIAATDRDLTADSWQLLAWLAERDDQLSALDRPLRAATAHSATAFNAAYRLLTRQKRWADLLTLCDVGEQAVKAGRWEQALLIPLYRAYPLAELDRGPEALAELKRAEPLAVRKLGVKLEQARVLGVLGRYDQAVRVCNELLTEFTDPGEVREVRVALATAYLGQNQLPKAETELRAVLEDDPDDALALNNLGYFIADAGRNLEEAEAMVRRAVELDRDERLRAGEAERDRGTYLDSLGWVLFRRGKLAEARGTLEKAGRSLDAASDPVVWDHLGDVCFRLDDKPAAKAAWAKADELYANTHQGRQHGRQAEVQRKLKLVP